MALQTLVYASKKGGIFWPLDIHDKSYTTVRSWCKPKLEKMSHGLIICFDQMTSQRSIIDQTHHLLMTSLGNHDLVKSFALILSRNVWMSPFSHQSNILAVETGALAATSEESASQMSTWISESPICTEMSWVRVGYTVSALKMLYNIAWNKRNLIKGKVILMKMVHESTSKIISGIVSIWNVLGELLSDRTSHSKWTFVSVQKYLPQC